MLRLVCVYLIAAFATLIKRNYQDFCQRAFFVKIFLHERVSTKRIYFSHAVFLHENTLMSLICRSGSRTSRPHPSGWVTRLESAVTGLIGLSTWRTAVVSIRRTFVLLCRSVLEVSSGTTVNFVGSANAMK